MRYLRIRLSTFLIVVPVIGLALSSFQNPRTGPSERMKKMAHPIPYEIILFWSRDDQAFVAEVPELPGCAADGATYQEALANAVVVIGEWIDTAQERGRPVPEPRGRLRFA